MEVDRAGAGGGGGTGSRAAEPGLSAAPLPGLLRLDALPSRKGLEACVQRGALSGGPGGTWLLPRPNGNVAIADCGGPVLAQGSSLAAAPGKDNVSRGARPSGDARRDCSPKLTHSDLGLVGVPAIGAVWALGCGLPV